ncbi:MAG: hypothetical protein JXP34_16280 [Planctomycetes bacterium]|nr:hypothetical protein [Planctomycetota bacterium]
MSTIIAILLAAAPALRVGYADIDLAPPLGVTMPGYFSERRATGVLDPLRAKALVLSIGEGTEETAIAIVACDLIGIDAGTGGRIRAAIQERTGIPAGCILLHATHTHTGATVGEIAGSLPGSVATAVERALAARVLEPRATCGAAEERTVAFIRRYLMDDGTVRTNPGRGNPHIVRPAGEIDPTVRVIAFETAKVLVVNYALHLDCIGGTQFSADYPHHMTEAIRGDLGAEWNVLFLNGCCGNVNHIDVGNPAQKSGYEESRRIGRAIANAALEARDAAAPIAIEILAAATETAACPVRKVAPDDLARAREAMAKDPVGASKRKFNEETAARIIALAEGKEATRPAEIIALRIGPLGLVGLPGEVFVELGRDIRLHSLFDPTIVVELTGGSMGYIPHPRGYDEGGYEATYASARLAPEASIVWCDTAIRLLKELKAKTP